MPLPKLGQALVAIAILLTFLGTHSSAGTLSGTATYRERIAVPQDATLYVQLQDVSRADAPSVTLAAQRYALSGVPAKYELKYDDALIQEGMRYVVSGSIYRGDELLFTTDTAYPVLTGGSGKSSDLILVQTRSQAGEMLEDTRWSATWMNGTAIETDKKPEISFAQAGAFSGSGGCNRFNGQADISGNSIDFPDNMAATLMACPPPMDEIERQFFQVLQKVTTYALQGDKLAMLDAAGEPVLQFVRTP